MRLDCVARVETGSCRTTVAPSVTALPEIVPDSDRKSQAAPFEVKFIERFYRRIRLNPFTGCHEWTGGHMPNGYGAVYLGTNNVGAHRVGYCLFNRVGLEATKGWCVCHRCNNKGCVNGEHLYLDTAIENTRQAARDGLFDHGRRQHLAKMTDETVKEARELYATGDYTMDQLAERFGITFAPMQALLRRNSWKHVP